MAITWHWDEKCGEATFRRENGSTYNVDLYVGNCFLIMIYEFKEDGVDKYTLSSFFVDDGHMERCLKDNIFTGYEKLVSISINKAKCRNYKKIVVLLTEYMDDVEIKVYKDGDYTWREFKEPQPVISDMRMREIAETAIDFMKDEYYIDDFLENTCLDLTAEEKEYFYIHNYNGEDEDDED